MVYISEFDICIKIILIFLANQLRIFTELKCKCKLFSLIIQSVLSLQTVEYFSRDGIERLDRNNYKSVANCCSK